jgi:microcompartment protein CcmK/EutM
LTSSALNGDVVEVVAIESLDLVQGYFTTTALTTTTADQVISSVSKSTYKGVKYVIVAKHGSAGNHATEVLVTHDGTTVYMSEYATVFSGSSLFSVDADISSDNLRLLVTPSNTNTTFRTFQIRLS